MGGCDSDGCALEVIPLRAYHALSKMETGQPILCQNNATPKRTQNKRKEGRET